MSIRDESEFYIERKVVSFAEKQGYLVRKMQYIGRRKAADRYFFGANGRLVMIEFKKTGEEPDEGQWREINRLRERGFEVYVIDNIADGIAIFQ